MQTKLTHIQPTVSVSLTVNIHADKTFLFLAGVLWLAWLVLARAGRRLARAYELGRAVVVVLWRCIRRALRASEKRFAFQFSLLAYGPVLGVG